MHNIPRDIGQPHVKPLMAECQSTVVKPEEVQECGVKIVGVHGVFGDAPTEFIGFTKCKAAFHASPREPDTERMRMMVTAVIRTFTTL